MQLMYIFGRTPQLARQELESAATILPFRCSNTSVAGGYISLKPEGAWGDLDIVKDGLESSKILTVISESAKLMRRVGGSVRAVWVTEEVATSEVGAKSLALVRSLLKKEKKATVGVSVYGKGLLPTKIAMTVKRQLASAGWRLRVVVPKEGMTLNTAQVVHNGLALAHGSGNGLELVLVEGEKKWYVGFTTAVPDLEDYSFRDFSIPKPNPVSGMLSPKLAQMLVNVGLQGNADIQTIYDPFCGNGRVILEASLMGLTAYGSDILEKQIEATKANLIWEANAYHLQIPEKEIERRIFQADAIEGAARKQAVTLIGKGMKWALVTEPYLGKPLREPLAAEAADSWLKELVPLYSNFLGVWSSHNCLPSERPQSIILVVPRAKLRNGKECALSDALVDSYNRFGYDANTLAIYDRPDALVRRDIVCINYR